MCVYKTKTLFLLSFVVMNDILLGKVFSVIHLLLHLVQAGAVCHLHVTMTDFDRAFMNLFYGEIYEVIAFIVLTLQALFSGYGVAGFFCNNRKLMYLSAIYLPVTTLWNIISTISSFYHKSPIYAHAFYSAALISSLVTGLQLYKVLRK